MLAGADDPRVALEDLARAYWRPVYGYVRLRWARTDEDALDATQSFFLWMLEGPFLTRADPRRGRFRGFVRVALDRFLIDLERERTALKRGGARTFVAVDDTAQLPDVGAAAPEEALDALWRAELLERATRELEQDLERDGKALVFAVFRDYFLAGDELDYAALAARHGITKTDVSNYLQRAKARYREVLRRVVRETVDSAAELDLELAWLFEERS